MNPAKLIKPNRYVYTSPDVPKAAVSRGAEASVAPGLPSPTQMTQTLFNQAGELATQVASGTREGINIGIDGRFRLAPLQYDQAQKATGLRVHENKENLDNYTRNAKSLGDQSFRQGMTVADRYAQLAGNTTSGVTWAIAGEQANDAARLQLMRDVLMKPKSFGETLAELAGAIAPIAALFV
jgi:hypothetical protein